MINTHHLENQVKGYVAKCPFTNQITLVHEPRLLGTAGTLIANLDFFRGADGLLIHADNYCLADLRAFVRAHEKRPPKCVMTMMTFRTDDPSSCGIVELDDRSVVVGFHEKIESPPGNLANGAVYILSAKLLERLGKDLHRVEDFSTEVLHRFLGRIYSYETAEMFVDVGTPAAYASVNN